MSRHEISEPQRRDWRMLSYGAALLAPAAVLLVAWPRLAANLFANGFGKPGEERTGVLRAALLISVLFLCGANAMAQPGPRELFIPVPQAQLSAAAPDQSQRVSLLRQRPTTKSLDLVRIDLGALQGDSAKLTLPSSRTLTFSKQSVEATGGTNFIWHGTLSEVPGTATLVVRNGNTTGTVQDGQDLYHIEPVGGGVHALIKIDPSKFPPEHPPSFESIEHERRGELPVLGTPADQHDGPVGIDVLVAYTASAKSSVSDIDATIELAVAEANQSYVNSEINIKLNLVDSFQITYTETGKSFETIRDDFVANTDVTDRRNNSGADLAALIINQKDACGLAKTILANASTAFAIVHYDCATGYYSFAHELGHLMGARHDEAHDSSTSPFAYGHGYQHTASPVWRTIMAYDCTGGCSRLQYWSNPNIIYQGVAMGTVATNDNARVLNATATTVAAFRPEVPKRLHTRKMADINNDGKADIVGFGEAGVWTALATGDGGFAPAKFVLEEFGANKAWTPSKHVRLLADVNNDGKADIVGFGEAGVWTALATGDGGFAPAKFVLEEFGANQAWTPSKHVRLLADINNDGKADIVGFGEAGVWTALATGDGGFAPAKFVLEEFGANKAWTPSKHVRLLADINNDGKADIVGFGEAGVWTALATGDGGFAPAKFVLEEFGANKAWTPSKHVRLLADINHDGKADIVGFGEAGVWTALATGDGGFAPAKFVLEEFGANQAWTPSKHVRLLADINHDGKADIMGIGEAGVWTALATGDGGFAPAKFVLEGFNANQAWTPSRHVRLLADINHDGKADIVGFGEAGVWTALSAGDGGFAPAKFVLEEFGANKGWRSAPDQ